MGDKIWISLEVCLGRCHSIGFPAIRFQERESLFLFLTTQRLPRTVTVASADWSLGLGQVYPSLGRDVHFGAPWRGRVEHLGTAFQTRTRPNEQCFTFVLKSTVQKGISFIQIKTITAFLQWLLFETSGRHNILHNVSCSGIIYSRQVRFKEPASHVLALTITRSPLAALFFKDLRNKLETLALAFNISVVKTHKILLTKSKIIFEH